MPCANWHGSFRRNHSGEIPFNSEMEFIRIFPEKIISNPEKTLTEKALTMEDREKKQEIH